MAPWYGCILMMWSKIPSYKSLTAKLVVDGLGHVHTYFTLATAYKIGYGRIKWVDSLSSETIYKYPRVHE
ncbi:hypothetical protein FRX31_016674 [Thalictrum thalictroides]|uniref:Uncharacterized protein n=1 Tax=Thalictrum thalictroides TaxID=46969 RepID=A0A7J6W8J1_THATH|nr:hypothetical protein FRX31_016674 [Thalictrum thalictroides]